MKSDEEILARIEEVKPNDPLRFETIDLAVRLPFEKIGHLLKSGSTMTRDEWKQAPRDRAALLKEMLDYMPFAWEKAKNCRGISASRSMSHFSAWIWLAGDDLGDLQEYEYYGKDNLVRICKHYGWDHTQWDDGIRVNSELDLPD